MQITQRFELQRPDLESCRAEGMPSMLSLLITEHCSVNTCNHLAENVKICLSYKKGGKVQLRSSNCRLKENCGPKSGQDRHFIPLSSVSQPQSADSNESVEGSG